MPPFYFHRFEEFMRYLHLAFIVTLTVPLSIALAKTRKIGTVKLLNNQEGVAVVVIPLVGSPSEAVVRVTGTGTEIDEQIHVVALVDNGSVVDYTKWNGGIVLINSGSTDWKTLKVVVPGRRSATPVYYDRKGTAEIQVEPIVAKAFNIRSESSRITDFAAADQKLQAQALENANRKCNTKITATLDYGKSNTADQKLFDIGSVCAQHIEAISDICNDKIGKNAVQKQIKTVGCQVGEELKSTLNSGKLLIITAPGIHDQKTRIYNWLDNNM